MSDNHTVVKRLPIWMAINTLLGFIVAFFVSTEAHVSFGNILLYHQILSQIIALSGEISGHLLMYRLREQSIQMIYMLTVPGCVLSVGVTCSLCVPLIEYLLVPLLHYRQYAGLSGYLFNLIIPSMLVSVLITSVYIYLEYRTNPIFNGTIAKKGTDADKKSITKGNGEGLPVAFSFRNKGEHVIIRFGDILYLSSRGMKTILHTHHGDFETNLLLKMACKKLPERDFLRVHKSFVVNLNRISRLQYFMGGSYIALLNDGDETELPVGRRYVLDLKKRMGIA